MPAKKPPKRKKPSPSRIKLTTRVTLLESSMRTDLLTIGRILGRLDTLEKGRPVSRETVESMLKASTERSAGFVPASSPIWDGYKDKNGRMVWWSNFLRVVDMGDEHLNNAIAYLKRGDGPFLPQQRADRLEALTFEAGRRAGKKGL